MGCRWEETHDCQFCVLDCPERHTSINIEALEQMASVPTPRQRDEIDEWLEKECHIYAGACSSVENLKYSTAREVAEKLWKKEEPVSEDLEQAATQYGIDEFPSLCNGCKHVPVDAFKVGAKWQMAQMMAKAIDGTARPDDNEIWCNLASFNLKDGDIVKVIVIKED